VHVYAICGNCNVLYLIHYPSDIFLLELVAVQVAKKRWNMHEMEAKSWNMWIKSMQFECNNYLSCESLLNMPRQWGPVFSCLIVLISFRTDKTQLTFQRKPQAKKKGMNTATSYQPNALWPVGPFFVSLFFFLFSVLVSDYFYKLFSNLLIPS
jgi:hypothetical protein